MSAKRVTSIDVARKAGVSRTTVSFVLNNVEGMQIGEETRKRVLEVARELGYVPDAAAQALASRRSKTIGLLLARRPNVIATDMFLTQIMEALVHQVNQRGMRLLLEVVEDFENQESYLKLVRSNSIDGILYSGPRYNDDALHALVDRGVPTVLIGALPEKSYYCVDIDNRGAAQRAVAHLIGLGHRRIGCITNAQTLYVASADRLLGYQDALQAAGLPFDPSLVRYGDFDPESGYFQMKSLIKSGCKLTAVFVASDVVALGALSALHEHGLRVPQDVALVGFDDVPLARFIEPSLTTIHLPVLDLARQASEMVVGLVSGVQPAQTQILLDAPLQVRRSCGACLGDAGHFSQF